MPQSWTAAAFSDKWAFRSGRRTGSCRDDNARTSTTKLRARLPHWKFPLTDPDTPKAWPSPIQSRSRLSTMQLACTTSGAVHVTAKLAKHREQFAASRGKTGESLHPASDGAVAGNHDVEKRVCFNPAFR